MTFTAAFDPHTTDDTRSLDGQQKLELIRKLRKGAKVVSVCEEYGMAKQTVLDISESVDKLVEYCGKYCVDASSRKSGKGAPRKNVRSGKDAALDATVVKWYVQQLWVEINVCGIEILAAAGSWHRY
ncbi:hypothetical protein E2C01_033880 [Portunus trituberculatus]|uniref:Uncharacterized protein n=1 Tax=Portunus trituberculatus TaxID=210409 RepID=A0A5B7F5F0_PORTR|nr:hypothetical protein [Portunus trituberculatus]